jgi:hypothetical protein
MPNGSTVSAGEAPGTVWLNFDLLAEPKRRCGYLPLTALRPAASRESAF